jgi:hypothetical protein
MPLALTAIASGSLITCGREGFISAEAVPTRSWRAAALHASSE